MELHIVFDQAKDCSSYGPDGLLVFLQGSKNLSSERFDIYLVRLWEVALYR